MFLRQTRKDPKDIKPDPAEGEEQQTADPEGTLIPSTSPAHEQRGEEPQASCTFDATMSPYTAIQRKEPYAFDHLEIEFDWPEDESPEQERRVNEAIKQMMRYVTKSDDNKMEED